MFESLPLFIRAVAGAGKKLTNSATLQVREDLAEASGAGPELWTRVLGWPY